MKCLRILLASIAAGLFIGLGGAACLYCNQISPVLGALVFPIGLYLICETRALLFTGKIGFIQDKPYTLFQYFIMLLGNMLGAAIFGYLIRYLLSIPIDISVKLFTNFLGLCSIFLEATLCGILVYIAVYLYQKGESPGTKFLGVFFPIFLFVLLGFRHCIADVFYYSVSLCFDWRALVALLLTILGNSIGAIGIHNWFKFYIR